MTDLKIPPHSIAMEQSVLGKLMFNEESASYQNGLTEHDFYKDEYKTIFKEIKKLTSEGKVCDMVLVNDELNNQGLDYIHFLVECTETFHYGRVEDHIEKLKALTAKRSLIKLGENLMQYGNNDAIETEKILESLKVSTENIDNGFGVLKKGEGTVKDALKQIQHTQSMQDKFNGKLGYDSPYPVLDELTKGIIPGKTYTIGAYSNTGKSRFSYVFTNNALAQGLKVYYFSLEVSCGDLLVHLQSQKDGKYFNYNTEIDGDFYENLMLFDSKHKLGDITQLISINKPDVVFIDFIQNVECPGGSEYEKMTAYAKEIQKTAIKSNSAIISLSQLANDTAQNVKKGNSDFVNLKGSGALTASSDVVYILNNGNNIGDSRTLELKVQKNKFGKNGDTFIFKADFGKYRFDFLSAKQQDEIVEQNFINFKK